MITVYTFGHTSLYDDLLLTNPTACKLGAGPDYEGGWIWKTEDEVKIFLSSKEFFNINWGDDKIRNPENFSVYKVLINDWNEISSEPDKNGIYRLLVDSKLCK